MRTNVSPRKDRGLFRATQDVTRKANFSLFIPRGGFRF